MGDVMRQIVRGCGNLPHVGEHPGTIAVLLFTGMGAVAGAHRSVLGAFVGALLMAAVFGPMYLWGAYDRARISDRIALQQKLGKYCADCQAIPQIGYCKLAGCPTRPVDNTESSLPNTPDRRGE